MSTSYVPLLKESSGRAISRIKHIPNVYHWYTTSTNDKAADRQRLREHPLLHASRRGPCGRRCQLSIPHSRYRYRPLSLHHSLYRGCVSCQKWRERRSIPYHFRPSRPRLPAVTAIHLLVHYHVPVGVPVGSMQEHLAGALPTASPA